MKTLKVIGLVLAFLILDVLILSLPAYLASAGEYFEMFKFKPGWKGFKAILRTLFESLHIPNTDKQSRMYYVFGKLTMMDIKGNPLRGYFCDEKIENAYFPFWRLSWTAIAGHFAGGKGREREYADRPGIGP
jgi:hypothetical protein